MSDTINVEVSEGNIATVSLDAVTAHKNSHEAGGSDPLLAGNLANFEADVKAVIGDDYLDAAGDTLAGDITLDTGEIAIDYTNKEIPQSFLGGPASSLTSYPLPESDLAKNFVDEAGDTMSGDLNVDGINSTSISGSDLILAGREQYFRTYDSVTGGPLNAVILHNDQSVEIPNGNLSLGTNQLIDNPRGVKYFSGNWNSGDWYKVSAEGGAGNEDIRFQFHDDSAATTTETFRAESNGNVHIPNGDLQVDGINQTVGGRRMLAGNGVRTLLFTSPGDGTGNASIYDEANSQDIAKFHEGGNVDIPNGHLSNSNGNLTLKQTGAQYGETRLEILNEAGANGAKFVQAGTANLVDFLFREPSGSTWNQRVEARVSSAYLSAPEIKWGTAANGFDEAFVVDSNGNAVFRSILNSFETLRLNDTGNVDIPNGELVVSNGNSGASSPYSSVLTVENNEDAAIDLFTGRSNGQAWSLRAGAGGAGGGETDRFRFYDITTDRDTFNLFTDGRAEFYGDVIIPNGSITQGDNPTDVIADSSTPKDLSFTGDDNRDILDQIVVNLENTSGASATEDITVDLYDGTDATGILLASETKSITLANGAATGRAFLQTDRELNNGDYYVEVAQSGTALTVTSSEAQTKGATYEFGQSPTGDLFLRNQGGVDVLTVDAIDETTTFKNGGVDLSSNDLTGVNAIHTPTAALGIWTGGGGTDRVIVMDAANGGGIAEFHEGGNVEIPNGHLYSDNITILGSGSSNGERIQYRTTSWDSGDYAFVKSGGSGASGHNLQYGFTDYSAGTSTKTLQLNQSGDVSIPSGDLSMGNNRRITLNNDVGTSQFNLVFRNGGAKGWAVNGNFGEVDEPLNFFDHGNSKSVVKMYRNGAGVEILDGGLSLSGLPLTDLRSSSTALAAADLATGEVAMDEANGRLVWKDASGSAYYAAGSALA